MPGPANVFVKSNQHKTHLLVAKFAHLVDALVHHPPAVITHMHAHALRVSQVAAVAVVDKLYVLPRSRLPLDPCKHIILCSCQLQRVQLGCAALRHHVHRFLQQVAFLAGSKAHAGLFSFLRCSLQRNCHERIFLHLLLLEHAVFPLFILLGESKNDFALGGCVDQGDLIVLAPVLQV